jgi:predicted dehydrogenase
MKNDRITIAMMGVRGRGRSVLSDFCRQPDVDVAWICDVDQNVVEPAMKTVEEARGTRPPLTADIRRVLEDKSVDAVVMATPIHWHAPGTILACDAGKDVYVEKPCSHNVREGRLMVEAARRNRRIVQHGTQLRSVGVCQKLIEHAHSGKLGRVHMAKAWNAQMRRNIGRLPDEPVPPGIDYDTWTGPLPPLPFNRNRFHSTVNWHWHYGCGDIGNDGVHQLDIARWALGVESPVRVAGMGRKLYFDDDQQTPDTMTITYEFPGNKLLFYEQRLWNPYMLEGCENGVAVYGDQGMAQFGRWGRQYEFRLYDRKGALVSSEPETLDDRIHIRNFLDCMRSRKAPIAEIEIGHRSTTLAHLGNIVARLNRPVAFDGAAESVPGDEQASRLLQREYRRHWSTPRL